MRKAAGLPHLATSSQLSGTTSSPRNRKLDCRLRAKHGDSLRSDGQIGLKLPVQLPHPAVGDGGRDQACRLAARLELLLHLLPPGHESTEAMTCLDQQRTAG